MLLANIRPLANRGSLDSKEAAVAVKNIPTGSSSGKETRGALIREVGIKGGISSNITGEGEKMKKKVKQGKKKMELKEKVKLFKEKVEPEIDLVQTRRKEKKVKHLIVDKIERKGKEKGKKKRKGRFEREKKKGVRSCNRCAKEFKFPTLLAEVSWILKLRLKKKTPQNL